MISIFEKEVSGICAGVTSEISLCASASGSSTLQLANFDLAIAMATGDVSIPHAESPNVRAANSEVPLPQKGSRITGVSFRCFLALGKDTQGETS